MRTSVSNQSNAKTTKTVKTATTPKQLSLVKVETNKKNAKYRYDVYEGAKQLCSRETSREYEAFMIVKDEKGFATLYGFGTYALIGKNDSRHKFNANDYYGIARLDHRLTPQEETRIVENVKTAKEANKQVKVEKPKKEKKEKVAREINDAPGFVIDGKEMKKGRAALVAIAKIIGKKKSAEKAIELIDAHSQDWNMKQLRAIRPADKVKKHELVRFFMKDPIKVEGVDLVICNQWDKYNIVKLINFAKEHGVEITPLDRKPTKEVKAKETKSAKK